MAKNTIEKSTLEYLGVDYEYKLLKILIEDGKFFACIESILDQNSFSKPEFREIVRIMKDLYHESCGAPLTYDVLDVTIKSQILEQQRMIKDLDVLYKIRDEIDNTFFEQYKEIAEKFFKQQSLTRAINEAKKIIERGDDKSYGKIEDMIRKSIDISYKNNNDFIIFDDDYEQAMNEEARVTIPTGCPVIDDMLMGGLGKGELGVIIAPSGVGKTSTTCGFAANAAINGYKVLHIFFEGTDNEIKRKYYGFVLKNIEAGDLLKPDYAREAKIRLREDPDCIKSRYAIRDNIKACHGSSGEMSATDIENKIKYWIARGFYPDMVIVDYFECIKLDPALSNENEFSREGVAMRKLESICKEYNVGMWVPVQGTKNSFSAEIIGMENAGGSIKKVQIGHVNISLAKTQVQPKNDKNAVVLNFALLKFRPGAIKNGGVVANIEFNNGTCRFGEIVEDAQVGGGDEKVRIANETKKFRYGGGNK